MSLQLTLIRHCKSSWDGNEEDHERPLNPRGRRAGEDLGRWLAEAMPEEVLCSDAVRTRETWDRIVEAAGAGPEATLIPDLYHAGSETILAMLKGATVAHVGLVGHNPGLAHFAQSIVAEPPDHPRFRDYPTGATTVIRFDAATWAEVGWKSGRVADFVVPREL